MLLRSSPNHEKTAPDQKYTKLNNPSVITLLQTKYQHQLLHRVKGMSGIWAGLQNRWIWGEWTPSQTAHIPSHHRLFSFPCVCVCVCVCMFRCDTTVQLAGCRQMPKPISWAWVQPWLSGDFSSTSLEPMKEVRTGQKQKNSTQECVHFVSVCYSACVSWAGFQMEMTAPVLVKIPEETKMWEPAVYTLNFPLPAAYQEKPPTPTNDKVSWARQGVREVGECRVRQSWWASRPCQLWGQVLLSSQYLCVTCSLIFALGSIESSDGCTAFRAAFTHSAEQK